MDLAQDTLSIWTAGIKVEVHFAACAKCADPDNKYAEYGSGDIFSSLSDPSSLKLPEYILNKSKKTLKIIFLI